jgi:hypothetical protein
MILFLNKLDQMDEKMRESPIRKYFPDYKGADTRLRAASS